MLKWLVRIVIGLGVFVAIVVAIGYSLPQSHVASRTAQFSQPPERVWAAITDFTAFPSWRKDVQSVEVLTLADGKRSWRETSAKGSSLTFVTDAWEPPRHMRARIADQDLPFGGSWDYAISPNEKGSTVTITEHGEVYNPIFRVVSRFMSNTATIDAYLSALAGKLGDSYTPPG
jgi:uncharacterized protein YndB with AHSA1/START domain